MFESDASQLILTEDLDNIYRIDASLWSELDNSRIFLTGGTGFFGCWLLRSLMHAIRHFGIRVDVTILSRDPDAFRIVEPELGGCSEFRFLKGDIANFAFPEGVFDYVIHGAADSSNWVLKNDPIRMCKSIINGVQRVLDFACSASGPRVLFLSSGASYGGEHPESCRIPEEWAGGSIDVLDIKRAYTETKRASEMLCTVYRHQKNLDIVIARCFSFIGPGLPLDANYAIGNFIGDALAGRNILVRGCGLEERSYLYTSDLVIWLWTLLVRGQSGSIVNVGSDVAYSIAEVARLVSEVLGGTGIDINGEGFTGNTAASYVPSVVTAQELYGLTQNVGLEESVRRTAICCGWLAEN
jgi:dTDP-glucose 4,6-dehydratase